MFAAVSLAIDQARCHIVSIYCQAMSDEAFDAAPQRPVDPAALARIRQRWSHAAQPPWLHGEVARRMAERLPVIRMQPSRVLDWWSAGAASHELLASAYPHAALTRVHAAAGTLPAEAARPWWSPRSWRARQVAEVAEAALAPRSADLLWANMTLHMVAQPLAQFQRWHELLAVDGFLMFSTLGPGSLLGLGELYARLGWARAHAAFVDMHDLGDMLVASGFADPVMDQEILTLTWPDANALLQELRALGGNADPARLAGLRTPRWRERLCRELQSLAGADGRLRLQFEVVYGHAFKPVARAPVAAQTVLRLDDMRDMVRVGRRGRPAGVG